MIQRWRSPLQHLEVSVHPSVLVVHWQWFQVGPLLNFCSGSIIISHFSVYTTMESFWCGVWNIYHAHRMKWLCRSYRNIVWITETENKLWSLTIFESSQILLVPEILWYYRLRLNLSICGMQINNNNISVKNYGSKSKYLPNTNGNEGKPIEVRTNK